MLAGWIKRKRKISRSNPCQKGSYYLVAVDNFSRWPQVHKRKKRTSPVTVRFLHEPFARYGILNAIVSVNGIQFTSDEFRKRF